MVDEASQLAMVAADNSRTEGTENVPTAVPEPQQAGGVKAAPKAGKQRPTRNVGTVAKMATEKVSAGRSGLIWTNPDPARQVGRTGNARTTAKDRKDPEPGKPVRGQPW